jgi:lipopolysaccharide/colanic/teichoic acid biosynthesis glycosyltransferase
MVKDADAALARLLATDAAARAEFDEFHKLQNDPRISKIGQVLRRTSLDELPQLINVARGDMYLVGPRPIAFHEVRHYGLVVKQSGAKPVHYLAVKPGITGLWQVSGRSNTTFEARVALDQAYVEHYSLWADVVILFKTIRVVLVREGAV